MKGSRIMLYSMLAGLIATTSLSASAQPASETASEVAPASTVNTKEAKAANRKLQKDIVRVLARTKGLVSTAITVRASDGDVTLEGAVPEQTQMTLATKATEGVAGVKSVKNLLTLSQF
jgi:hyperosmotically inducible periplasmic protein